MARVRLAGIAKSYGDTVAVHELDLEIAQGELVTLLGPSGCGKTTTLRMVAGLIEPTRGSIWFDDLDVTWLPPRKRNIGFVFQTPALFPHLSVAANVGFGLSVKRGRKEDIRARVDEMLRLVELDGYQDRLPRQLSGGQQQRVALARVLATDPRVLLFDEPLSALDRNLRDTLKYAILDLQRRTGKTAIYVTHDQSEAFAISDRVAVMNGGRIEQIGSQTDIYLRPATKFVANFIGANNAFPSTVVAIEGDADERRVQVSAGTVTLWCLSQADVAVGDSALAYVRPEDISVLEGDEPVPPGANVIEGSISRVIFEGPSAQVRVDVDGRDVRVDVTGGRRLTLEQRSGRVRLMFAHVTLIRDDAATRSTAGGVGDG